MTLLKDRLLPLALCLVSSVFAFSQNPKSAAPEPKSAKPETTTQAKPESKTPEAKTAVKPDKAEAYYHYSLGHIYEELVSNYARSEFAGKAIEEYKKALEYDPDSSFLNAGLAELYARTGRIRDAVLEAQEIIKRDPKNLEARRLLGRIYLRSLGDLQQGTQSQEVLKLAIEQFQQIVLLDPKSVDDHLLLGRLYRLNNDLLKAENEFKAAVQLQPDSEEALTSLAYLYTEEGDGKRAVETLESVPDAGRSARLYAALGYTYEQQHEYKKAIDAYKRSVELDRENLDSLRGLAQNLLNDGQTDAALQQYKSVAEADPQDAQAQLRIAEIYRQTGKFDQALDYLKRAEGLVQDSVEVQYNIALVYEAQGKYEEAAQALQNVLKRSEKADNNYPAGERNNRAVFMERLGIIYREQGKYPQALEAFSKLPALGEDPAERGYEQMVETYRSQKEWPRALTAAQEATAKLPKSHELKVTLAMQMADNNKGTDSVSLLKSLLENKPSDREVYLALAQVNSSLHHFEEAEKAAAEAEKLSLKPEEKDYAQFVAGSVYEHEKKYDLAEQKFKTALSSDPRNASVLNYLGYMLADRGLRLEEALGYIKRALEQEPQNAAYLDSLGWAYFKLGNYELAEANLNKATERLATDGTVQAHLASLYFKTGRVKEAAAHWERALQEWSKATPGEVDSNEVARVQKELESARVKLAKEQQQK